MEKSQKVIGFIDVGGSESQKALQLRGFGLHPDYALIVVDAHKAYLNCKAHE